MNACDRSPSDLCAECRAGGPRAVLPATAGGKCGAWHRVLGEDETQVLNLFIFFFSLLSVYCLTPCQNSVHLTKLKGKEES